MEDERNMIKIITKHCKSRFDQIEHKSVHVRGYFVGLNHFWPYMYGRTRERVNNRVVRGLPAFCCLTERRNGGQ